MKKQEKLLCVSKRLKSNLVYNNMSINYKTIEIMREFLTEEMLQEMVSAVMNGKEFNYTSDDTHVHVTPNGISIKYTTNKRDREVRNFLDFCDKMDDRLFVKVCESFEEGELEKLQNDLDTDNYMNTINTFRSRTKTVADNLMAEVIKKADAQIRRQEEIIANAKEAIKDIHNELEHAHNIYNYA